MRFALLQKPKLIPSKQGQNRRLQSGTAMEHPGTGTMKKLEEKHHFSGPLKMEKAAQGDLL